MQAFGQGTVANISPSMLEVCGQVADLRLLAYMLQDTKQGSLACFHGQLQVTD